MATGTNSLGQDQLTQTESLQLKSGSSGYIDLDSTTGTAAAGAVTVTKYAAQITSEALTQAQNATYTLTITDTLISATDLVMCSLTNGTNTQGTPMIVRVTPAAGSLVILVKNMHDAAQALNGTIIINFISFKA